jgi:hypothetical protein
MAPPDGYLTFPCFSFSDIKINNYGALVNDIDREKLEIL